jgi:RNA polymerase sigma-70 factor (ECF subfamily)
MIADKEHIVAACQRKDQKAMKQLYEELAPAMLGVCMRYTHSRDEAQDILHDGFIKVYENIGKLKDASALESWVYHIMVSLSVDYLRRESNLTYYDMNSLADLAVEENEEELDLDRVDRTMKEVVAALQSLPASLRVVFNMRAVEEKEYEEIALLLHKSETTVRGYMARARQMIIEKLNMKGIDNE